PKKLADLARFEAVLLGDKHLFARASAMSQGQAGTILQYIRRLAGGASTHQAPDRELLQRFTGRQDSTAFAALVERHGPMVLRVCRRVLHDHHATEDAFQATFLVLARKAGSI